MTDGECGNRGCVLVCFYLSTVPQHGIWRFGQLLSANDLENELLLGISWKGIITEWVEGA